MWLSRYPIPIGSEFIGNEFRKYLIETQYGIPTKPITSIDSMSNEALERIHQVLRNLVWTYKISQT